MFRERTTEQSFLVNKEVSLFNKVIIIRVRDIESQERKERCISEK